MKTRSLIIIASIIIVSVGVGFVILSNNALLNESSITNELPQLTILKTNGESFLLPEAGERTILIFFNPDCDHCQREATLINENKRVFKDYTLYFISTEPAHVLEKFATDYGLTESNFVFGQADGNEVFKAVGSMPSVPTFFIYQNRQLMQRLDGEVKLEEIQSYL